MDVSQPIVLVDSKETHIVAYLDETPTLKPCNLNLTYEYSSDFLLGESSHRELGFCEEFEATPGAESSSKQMEEEEMDSDDTANCRAGEEMLTAVFSPKKNSAFLSIGGMKLFTQDISDGGSDGESLDESSESQRVELSQSDDSEDASNSELDVDDDVAEDYLEGIGGSSNILDVKWLVENVLDDSEEDSSSSGCFDETLEKLGGIALQEASRRYGMKKPQSKKNHASSARDVSQDLDDFMHVKDPRTVSAKKKHVARLPWSSQRSKNSRNFPGNVCSSAFILINSIPH
jgi:G patch domain-containing protein 2